MVNFRANDRTEEDVRAILRHPSHMAGSDGIFRGGFPHPRGWGAFARYLGHHTRTLGDYTWPEAVTHLATHAARRFRLTDRGLVRPGFVADLALFDPRDRRRPLDLRRRPGPGRGGPARRRQRRAGPRRRRADRSEPGPGPPSPRFESARRPSLLERSDKVLSFPLALEFSGRASARALS